MLRTVARIIQIVGVILTVAGFLVLVVWAWQATRPALACGVVDAVIALDLGAAYKCLDQGIFDPYVSLLTLLAGWIFTLAGRLLPVTGGGDSPAFQERLAERAVEEAYLASLLTKYREWELKYTPLAGIATVEERRDGQQEIISPEFMHTSLEKPVEYGDGPEKRIELVPVPDLRAAVSQYRRLVVLGEPGSGKTTILRRLVYDYALAAQKDPEAPIPFFVPLNRYTGPEPALDYAATCAKELRPYLQTYLERGRAVLLLDGLNEMPRKKYKERVDRIQNLLDTAAASVVVVTCRKNDYNKDLKLDEVDVKPLDRFQQREYLQRYLGEEQGDRLYLQLVGGDTSVDLWATWKQQGWTFEQFWNFEEWPVDLNDSRFYTWLLLRMNVRASLLTLCANPLSLFMFVKEYYRQGKLPQNLSKLLGAFVAMLIKSQCQHHPKGWPGADALHHGLATLAFAMQESGAHGTAVTQRWAVRKLSIVPRWANKILGLGVSTTLLDLSGDQIRFVHNLIQEYFAAVAWQTCFERGDDLRKYWSDGWVTPSGWEGTAVLLAGMLPDMTAFVEALLPVNPALAARCIAESGGPPPGEVTVEKVQETLVVIATSLTAPVEERNAAGNALNFLGDPRPGVGVKKGLPDIAWCEVPAGEFLFLGDDINQDDDNKKTAHPLFLDSYEISKYPITNAQYQVFLDDKGREGRTVPERANHPVDGVTWYEADDFCRWLTEKLGRLVTLPTEAQWEKAALGTDGRRYPWGPKVTLEYEKYLRLSENGWPMTAVGIFIEGESPYGAFDMVGNAWEWVADWHASDYDNETYPILRGGASDKVNYFLPRSITRRVVSGPHFWNEDFGFRCVRSQ